MIRRRIFVRHSGRRCSHCRKKVARMRKTHRGDNEFFHYRCPFCHSVWCRHERVYGTLEEIAADLGVEPDDLLAQQLELAGFEK